MADAANYWSKGSLDAEIKTAYVYAIWDGTGIVWALGGYSGFTRCPASTTATDDDFFLLEEGSTYTKAVTEYCVCVGKIRYQYDTADTPDHTIQATVLDAPQVMWNPKSDYGYRKTLAADYSEGAGDIADRAVISFVVKQSGHYDIISKVSGTCTAGTLTLSSYIRVGSGTYGSATVIDFGRGDIATAGAACVPGFASPYLNAGESIHLGASLVGGGTHTIRGDNYATIPGPTSIIFRRTD